MAEKPKTRIQQRNEKQLLDAAETVFSSAGYHGATLEKIAFLAGMSQPNLHHYFATKRDLYVAVLDRTLGIWLGPLDRLDPAGDPAVELRRYISLKMELSRARPEASRIFAGEMLLGASMLGADLTARIARSVDHGAATIRHWNANGLLMATDPHHLLFLIWAATQHYADFGPQIKKMLGKSRLTKSDFTAATASVTGIILHGILPLPNGVAGECLPTSSVV
jgi:TetR/AcrR family transcriptional regulator